MTIPSDINAPIVVDLKGAIGRELEVRLTGGQNTCLGIREAKISAKPKALVSTNVALGKMASESAEAPWLLTLTLNDNGAEKAVDGNRATYAITNSMSPTQINSWKVYLGQKHHIDEIKIYAQQPGQPLTPYLDRFSLYLDGELVCPLKINGDKYVRGLRYGAGACDEIVVKPGGLNPATIEFYDDSFENKINLHGKTLEIRRVPLDKALYLGEVEIYGTPDLEDAPDQMWGIGSDGKTYRVRGNWEHVPSPPLKKIFAVSGGYAWGIGLGSKLYRWSPQASKWQDMPDPPIPWIKPGVPSIDYAMPVYISEDSNGKIWLLTQVVTKQHSAIYWFDGFAWQQQKWDFDWDQLIVTSPGQDTNIALGQNNIFRLGLTGKHPIRNVPGKLTHISASGSVDPWNSGEVWGVNFNDKYKDHGPFGTIYRWTKSGWKNMSEKLDDKGTMDRWGWGALTWISVGAEGTWGVNKENQVFRWWPDPNSFNGGRWERVKSPWGIKQISVPRWR